MGFQRVSKNRCCQLCQGDHACSVTNGLLYLCKRRHHGDYVPGFVYIKETKCGTWGLYRREGDDYGRSDYSRKNRDTPSAAPAPNPNKSAQKAATEEAKYRDRVAKWEEGLPTWVEGAKRCRQDRHLAEALGVPVSAVRPYQIGYIVTDDEGGPAEYSWVWAERGADGKLVGVATRDCQTHEKKCLFGGHRGLTFATDATTQPVGYIFHPEGLSDCCSLTAIQLECVGRPSNTGGAIELADWYHLRPWTDDLTPVVIGERDGRWKLNDKTGVYEWIEPGVEGGRKVAQELANSLGRPVSMCLPPEEFKDTRKWFNATVEARGIDLNDREAMAALGREYVALLLASAEEYRPSEAVAPDAPGAPVEAEPQPRKRYLTRAEWREEREAAEEERKEKRRDDAKERKILRESLGREEAQPIVAAIRGAVTPPPEVAAPDEIPPPEPEPEVEPSSTGGLRFTLDLRGITWEDLENRRDDRLVVGRKGRFCGHCYKFRFRNGGHEVDIALRCRRWLCADCIHNLKQDWRDHLPPIIAACETVYYWIGPRAALDAIKKSITKNGRAAGLWEPHGTRTRFSKKTGDAIETELGSVGRMAYHLGGDTMLVIAEVPFAVPKKHGGEVLSVTGVVGAAIVRGVIDHIPQCLRRPLSTSFKWAMHRERKTPKLCFDRYLGGLDSVSHWQTYQRFEVRTKFWCWSDENPQPWSIDWAMAPSMEDLAKLSEADRICLDAQLRGRAPPLRQAG